MDPLLTLPKRSARKTPAKPKTAAPSKPPVLKPAAAAPYTLSPDELAAFLGRTASQPVQYVSRPHGSMMVAVAGRHFEFVCNKRGVHYYRCMEHRAHDCEARVLVQGLQMFVQNGEHRCQQN